MPHLRLNDGFWEVYSPLSKSIEESMQEVGYSPDEIKAADTFLYEGYANARSAYKQQLLELRGYSVPQIIRIRQSSDPQAVSDIQKIETGVGNEANKVARINIDWNILGNEIYISITNNTQPTPDQKKRIDAKIEAARKDFAEGIERLRRPPERTAGISSITGSEWGIYRMTFNLLSCGGDLSYTSGDNGTKFTAHIKRMSG